MPKGKAKNSTVIVQLPRCGFCNRTKYDLLVQGFRSYICKLCVRECAETIAQDDLERADTRSSN